MLTCILSLIFAPAIAADKEQYESEWIGIGRYMGYEDHPSITSSNQVMAQFSLIHTLKGPPVAVRTLRVRYSRRSKVEQPPEGNGTIDLLSQVPNRSNWIIFIQYAYSRKGGYDTFNGNKGIIPCTKTNLDDVLDGIERADPHLHFDDSARRVLYDNAGIEYSSMLRSNPYDAEAFYRPLLSDDTEGDAYAGLAIALCRQNKIPEARKVIGEARDKGFFDNPKVLAAAGFVSEADAQKSESRARKDLYDEAALMLCQRALKIDPTNEVALETIKLANKNRMTYTNSIPAGVVLQGSPPSPGPGQTQLVPAQGDFGSDRLFFVPGRGLGKQGPGPGD